MAAVGVLVGLGVAGCSDSAGPDQPRLDELSCSIPEDLILNGGPGIDGIPALTNPELVALGEPGAEYLRPTDRVVGLPGADPPLAIPLNIFWWHEIVNLRVGGADLAVTHCPLTGSTLAFDRAVIDGAELGVSGLLFMNNLIMYDRTGSESLWPQMLRGARCGPRDGTQLPMVPVVEMTWAGWRALHPDTRVVSSNTGHRRDYTVYPYGDYDRPDNPTILFPMPDYDDSRPPKERVLGIAADGGVAFPFGLLTELGRTAAVHTSLSGLDIVVLWDELKQAAMAYEPTAAGRELSFTVDDGRIVDRETRTVWRVDGSAIEGELAGETLEPVAEAFIAFWFAWTAFHPEADLWRPS